MLEPGMSSGRELRRSPRLCSDSHLSKRRSSFQGPPEESLCHVDRFSALPDALAYCILSFLDLGDDFPRLMAVSKRWNHLCRSAPSLSMVNTSFTHDSTFRADKLSPFLARYFSCRAEAGAKVERLRIGWSFLRATPLIYGFGKRNRERDCDEEDAVFTCLSQCAPCCDPSSVEVNLVLREGGCFEPYLALLLFRDIRNVVLSMNNSVLPIPSWFSFPPLHSGLQNLTLRSAKIPSKSFKTLFGSSNFPNLKQLRLYECSGVECLYICNQAVELLEIVKCGDLSALYVLCRSLKTLLFTWYPDPSTRPFLELYAPKLEHFEWKGFPVHVVDGAIYQHINSTLIYCTEPSRRSLDKNLHIFVPFVVGAFRKTKSLRLLAKTTKILFRQNDMDDAYPLRGVETLHVDDCYLTDDEVPAIAYILQITPELKYLYVSSSKVAARTLPEVSGFKMDYWEAQDMKSINKLETATLEIHKEGNATELVKYFAKHGKHLKSLKVICPSAMVSTVSRQIKLVKRNLDGCCICARQ